MMMPIKGKQALRKGNGKPKEQSKSSVSNKNTVTKKEIEPNEIKENTLTFPLLKTVDNGRFMPRYTSIINRTEEEGVRYEDLDILKIELKGLLANVSVRVRVLQNELRNLGTAPEEKKDKKRQLLDKAPASPAKRGKHDEKPIKKMKEVSIRGRELIASPPSIKITRVKSVTVHGPVPPSAALPPEPEPPRIITPKNDNPSKFWVSLEPYCADITTNDIKFLEENVRIREKGPEFPPIQPLGDNFTAKWAKEDLKADQEASSSLIDKRSVPSTSNIIGKKMMPKVTNDVNGPFTQRLVSALIEENIASPKEKSDNTPCKDGENITPSKTSKMVSSGASNMEKIVRKELEDQGLLEKEAKLQMDDEIMKEIMKTQNELAAVQAYNYKLLKQVLLMAKEQMPRQEIKKKLRIADNEIREVYKKFAAAKLKKKIPSKREKEHAWRLLKERDFLLRQLNTVPFTVRKMRGLLRPQSSQGRATEKAMFKPPISKGMVDKSRIAFQEKHSLERCNVDRQTFQKVQNERQMSDKPSLDKTIGKFRQEGNPVGKPNCAPLVKPPLDNPPMDNMMP